MVLRFPIGPRSDVTGRRSFLTLPIYKMNTYPLTDRDFTVIRFRIIFHNVLYVLFVASTCLTVAYQLFLSSTQLKARNWIGFMLPLLTGMSDPRVAFLHEASTPILFIGWLSLGAEWYSAFLDTKNSEAHGYAPGVLYAERVGCVHGSSACDILTCDTEEYDIYGYPISDPDQVPAGPQPSHQIGLLPITLPHPAAAACSSSSSSRAPVAPRFPLNQDVSAAAVFESARIELSSVQCYQAPLPQQVVDQIEVLEYLPTDNSRSLHEEESIVHSVPARIETPRPVRASLANLANMLGWNIPGDVTPRVDTPHPNHSCPRQ